MNKKIEASTYERYLEEVAGELIHRALEAKRRWKAISREADIEKHSIAWGELLALYGVITLMQQQAECSALPMKKIGLGKLNPDKELLS